MSDLLVLPKLVGVHSFKVYAGDVDVTEDGRILGRLLFESPEYKNLIVTGGKQAFLDRAFGLNGPPAAFSSVGVGTDSTAAAAGQTQLNPSVAGSVLIQAPDGGYPSRAASIVTVQATFGTAVANFNIQEGAVFNGTVNGTSTMLNRAVIGPFNKTNTVSFVYQVQITQS